MNDDQMQQRLSAALLRLRGRQPFFGALALFARQKLDDRIKTAATDGRDILWNRDFLAGLAPTAVDAVLLHEVLHAALRHVTRRGGREKQRWNIAADVVVNGMIDRMNTESGGDTLRLPDGAVRSAALADLTVEEAYERLLTHEILLTLPEEWQDLQGNLDGDPPGEERSPAQIEAYWQAAGTQAKTLVEALGQGTLPVALTREWETLQPAHLDWRAHLWRYLVRTPTDFGGWDRRSLWRGLYLETLESESLRVFVCVDTSGSINQAQLSLFLGEVGGILRAYPHLVCDLFYADADVSAPHRFDGEIGGGDLPAPTGGGGTDFRPFFEKAAEISHAEHVENALLIYLTDGYGVFPEYPPQFPTLWVVAPGGLLRDRFPFGEVTRLLTH